MEMDPLIASIVGIGFLIIFGLNKILSSIDRLRGVIYGIDATIKEAHKDIERMGVNVEDIERGIMDLNIEISSNHRRSTEGVDMSFIDHEDPDTNRTQNEE
jgi:hypothetical protein